jgi:hypothetical protein
MIGQWEKLFTPLEFAYLATELHAGYRGYDSQDAKP